MYLVDIEKLKESYNLIKVSKDIMWVNAPAYSILLLTAVFVILFLEKERLKRVLMGWYSLLMLLILISPFTPLITGIFFGQQAAYYCRLYSMISVFAIIGYAVVLIAKKLYGIKKFLAVCAAITIIYMSGFSFLGEDDTFTKAENLKNIPQDVVSLSKIIEKDKGDGYKRVIIPNGINIYVRQLDPSIIMVQMPVIATAADSYYADYIDYVRKNNCDYWLCEKNKSIINKFKKEGAVLIGKTDHYAVFKDDYHSPIREYDDLGNVISKFYYDNNGNLKIQDTGYAGIRYEYDDLGNETAEYYYGEDNKPIALSLGQYGKAIEYDNNKIIKVTYLNSEGKPTNLLSGGASTHYYYDNNGNICSERYYDEKDEPVINGVGFAGIDFNYDEEGRIICFSYIGLSDIVIENVWGYAYLERKYEDDGTVMDIYLDIDKQQIMTAKGYAAARTYYENGEIVNTEYYDLEGNEITLD